MAKLGDSVLPEKRVGPELRLIDRRAFVGFPELELAPGLVITDFALQIPEVTFPFNVTGGASRFQKKKLDFGFLELTVDAELISRKVSELSAKLPELDGLKLTFRPGYVEGQARLRGVERAPVTFKLAFDGDADALGVYVYDVRLYAFSSTPAAQVPVMLARALSELAVLPRVSPRGANGFTTRVLPELVQAAAVSRGYKVPGLELARLSSAEVSGKGLKLRFASGGLPPPQAPDEELLLALEGARAFADAEELVALGKLKEAREAYLKLGDVHEAHPFAAERLLSLLVADPQAHELALDIAAQLGRRRERSAAAIWAEAVVRERRGESARAAERYLALCALARKNQEEAAGFFAAEAAARAARDHAPQMAVRALHELLGLKPDHLPSLKALARASDLAEDRAGAIRAYRRIAALAREPSESAEAHVHLARLCALTEDDVAGARLHCEAALRLSPDHPDALFQLGELCAKGGEHLRAIKALDRLREVATARHEIDRVGKAGLLAGRIWEEGLKQPENALLRYREAISLLPGEPEPHFLCARVAESLNRTQEALSGYQQAIELAGPAPRAETVRRAAHQAHHALARLHRKLADPSRAREHLEAALALEPRDMVAIEELLPYFRATGKVTELADACQKAALVVEEPQRRAALLAEAGELFRGRLSNLEKAERLLSAALDADGKNRVALEGLLALAESRRDGAQLCRCLSALAELATEPKERARHLRRLAVAARDLCFDLEQSAKAFSQLLVIEPDDLAALSELCGLQRRRGEPLALAQALEQRAASAERQGDARLAGAALRELAQVLESRLGRVGEALVALERAARLAPDPSVLFDLAQLSVRCERPEHARKALEDLLATLPKHAAPERVAEIRTLLGKACEQAGDKDRAKESYAAAFPLRRLDDDLAARLEALYEEAGQRRELTELWSARAQALLGAARSSEAAPLFLKSAQALLAAGDHGGAVQRFSAALEAAPRGERAAEILEAMAELEIARGERLEAAKLLARKAALLGNETEAAQALFRAATLAVGTPREASFLDQCLEKDAAFAQARIRRASLCAEEDPRAALADLEAVLALPGSQLPVELDRYQLSLDAARAARRASLADTARRHLAYYASARSDDLEALVELAALHRDAGAKDELCELLAELWPRLGGSEQKSARREHATLCLELGRVEQAIGSLRAVLEAEPADRWAATQLIPLLPEFGAEALAERLKLFDLLVSFSHGDDRAELLARRARTHHSAGDLASARGDLEEAAACASKPAPLFRELAELCRQLDDEQRELSAWRAAAKLDSSLAQFAAARILELSARRLLAKDAMGAKEGYAAAVGLSLGSAERCEAYFGLASAEQALNDLTAAAGAYLEASKQGPAQRRCEALLSRARLLESQKELAAAAESFEAALALWPRHLEATAGLKRVLEELGDWAALADVIGTEAAQAPKPAAGALFAQLGALYLDKLEQKGPAEAAFKRAIQLGAGSLEVRRRLYGLLAGRNELAEAIELLEQTAATLAAEEAAMLLREGVPLCREAGELERALRLARLAHAHSPAHAEQLHELAELLYLRGAVKEALPVHQALATELDFNDEPDRASAALLRLAELAQQVNDLSLAEHTLRRLVQERPGNAVAVERLAELLRHSRPREAIELLAGHASSLSRSEHAVRMLCDLSDRARRELADVDLCARLLERAAELSDEPLALHRSLANLFRESGRTQELSAQLSEIASLELEGGDAASALEAYEEEAHLAEVSGRIDEALRTLEAAKEICVDEGQLEQAAGYERRRAELLRDAKLDQDGAEAALKAAFELHAELSTAQLGLALASRREDREAEMDWLERTVDLVSAPPERARIFLRLARLHLHLGSAGQLRENDPLAHAPLTGADAAEAALREALKLEPSLTEAETLLGALFEKQGRLAELAAHYEEAGARLPQGPARAHLLWKAAETYKDRADRPHQAAVALLAARAANPDDLSLTARAADMLQQIGREADAAELDALLLEADPFHAVFERHSAFLEKEQEHQALGALWLGRAQRQAGAQAASSFLLAASAFRRARGEERAALCEEMAFDAFPQDDAAFAAMRDRNQEDPRKLGEILRIRAAAVEAEAPALLAERAQRLVKAGEVLLAAEAFDDLLRVRPGDLDALQARAELAAQGGGAKAAQPYDRALLQAAGEALPLPVRLKTQLRVGHAALETQAFHDAADAFEAVVSMDPDGEKGREALSLLAEVHTRTRDPRGLFHTTLRLAQKSRSDEAEALYRRAADLFDAPVEVIDALLPLNRLRPGDEAVIDRLARGLKELGRNAELVDLYERAAQALGGTAAAERLLLAASVAEEALLDAARASELRQQAAKIDPDNVPALRALASEQRKSADPALLSTLERLLSTSRDAEELALLRMELAERALAAGQTPKARRALEDVVAAGPSGAGYAAALEGLEKLLRDASEDAALGPVLAARAELTQGAARAKQLLDAAFAAQRSNELSNAMAWVKDSLATSATPEGLLLLSSLCEAQGQLPRAAQALLEAAKLSSEPGKLVLKASELWQAAGEPNEAIDALEKVAREHAELLAASELSARFGKLGAVAQACAHGFEPAFLAGHLEEALALAMAAKDAPLSERALWALAEKDAHGPHARQLAELLSARSAELLRLAELAQRGGAKALSVELCRRLLSVEATREAALRLLLEWDELPAVLEVAKAAADEALSTLLLDTSKALATDKRALVLEQLAFAAPEEERAALYEELGGLYEKLERPEDAQRAYERANAENPDALGPISRLLGLYERAGETERFVQMAETLLLLEGEEALEQRLPQLAEAYEKLGRKDEAYQLLGKLPESEALLKRRAALADQLGLGGEALVLRERLTSDRGELEKILENYVRSELVPFAVKLAERLLSEGALPAPLHRLLAERLAPTAQGAKLAVRLWRELLSEKIDDADGWTLLAEALRLEGRTAEGVLADGFGAALTSSSSTPPVTALAPVRQGSFSAAELAPPSGCVALTEASFPRLHLALSEALAGLGADGLKLYLHPSGGPEAYLLSKQALVLGGGALGCFGPAELIYLCALALALGDEGRRLARPGAVEDVTQAAVRAFEAFPCSLAAGRVLTQLDPRVRGTDPALISPSEVLTSSEPFRAVTLKALELVG